MLPFRRSLISRRNLQSGDFQSFDNQSDYLLVAPKTPSYLYNKRKFWIAEPSELEKEKAG